MYKQTNTICKPKRFQIFALIINCTAIMKKNGMNQGSYSVHVPAVLEYWISGSRTLLVPVCSTVVVLIPVLVLGDKYSGTCTSTDLGTDSLWYIWDTSTVYWCIASKLKVPLIFLWNEQNVFVLIYQMFNQSYSGGIISTKSLPDIGGTTIQYVGSLAAMGLAMEPGVHTMSDELKLQISCNIFLAFKWILLMRSCQNISHYTTAKPSVHVWNHDLIWWQNKIDTQKKHFHKTTITSS